MGLVIATGLSIGTRRELDIGFRGDDEQLRECGLLKLLTCN
jgi:hypothetical protein